MPAYGPHGMGFLMYQRDGYMCADLVDPHRPKWVDGDHKTVEEKAAAADHTFAYCGRYGDWGYMWTDESFISGERAARKILKEF